MTVVKVDPQYDGKPFGVREIWNDGNVRYQVFDQETGSTLANRKRAHEAHRYAQDFNRRYV